MGPSGEVRMSTGRRHTLRLALMGAIVALGLLPTASRAQGVVESRLQVVSMWDTGFKAFARPGELADGATGPGLEEMIEKLDRGAVPRGVLLGDRTVRWASEAIARAYGAVRVLAEVKAGEEGTTPWDVVKWTDKPGERSVWVVEPSGRGRPQQLFNVVLKAAGPARHFIPATPGAGVKLVALRYPLEFLGFHEERGDLWEKYLSRTLDPSHRVAVVGGANSNALFPDVARIVLDHAEQATDYKVVLVWRQSPQDIEAPRSPRRP
jgi:hypothetical protein